MNKQLELLLKHFTLCHVQNGSLFYSLSSLDGGLPLGTVFTEIPRFAKGINRENYHVDDFVEIAELWLMVEIDSKMNFHLELRTGINLLDRTSMTMVNATVPAIEQWLLSANKDITAIPEHVKQYLKDLQKK